MAKERRENGVLHALASNRAGSYLWPEGFGAALIGLGGGCYLLANTPISTRLALVSDSLSSLGVLLGVVFAAFALVFSQVNDDYLLLLDRTKDGVAGFIRPFLVAVGIQIATLFAAMAYRGAAEVVPSKVEVGLFLAWAFLFSYAILDVAALTRNISMHSKWRTALVRGRAEQADAEVRDLRPPRDQAGS